MSKVSDYQAMQMVAGVLGVHDAGASFYDLAKEFDRTHPDFPFQLSLARVVYERVEVLTEVLFSNGRRKDLLKYFDEVEVGTPIILFDSRLAGRDGVMVAFEMADWTDIVALMQKVGRHQKKVWFLGGNIAGRAIVVFRLREFIS